MKKDKKEKKPKVNFWKSIWDYTQGHHGKLAIAVVMTMMNGICVAIQPTIVKYILDDGISNDALSPTMKIKTVIFWALVYLFVSGMRLPTWAAGYKCAIKAVEGFLFNIRSKLFRHIQSLCMRFYDTTSAGELFNYIMGTPITNIKTFLMQFVTIIPVQLVALFIGLGTMFTYDWLLSTIMALGTFACVVINVTSRPKIRKRANELIKSESEASKYIDSVIHGGSAIKMYAIEDDIFKEYSSHIDELRKKGEKLTFLQWLSNAKAEFANYLATTAIYIVGAVSCVYRGLSVGELVAFLNCMSIIMAGFTAIFNANLLKASAESGLDRIMQLLDIRTTTPDKDTYYRNVDVESYRAQNKGKPCVEFKNVNFGYDDRMIFEDFNCSINFNESVALVGTSGSGKSTVTKLIMRLYDINSGELDVYGRNIKDFSLHDLRKSIGIVPQDPYIFQSTIMENIRMTYPEAPMQEVIKAMDIARVHEFVNDMPNGWNTIVGEDGFGLSGGQRQRIAIARAILGNPKILIFDEATSALDNISEKHVQMAMEELMQTHTVIIVAHRLSTIKNVDRILVFDKGKVVEEGKFDELLERDGLFKKMYDAAQND